MRRNEQSKKQTAKQRETTWKAKKKMFTVVEGKARSEGRSERGEITTAKIEKL